MAERIEPELQVHDDLVAAIKPMLAGKHPMIQSSVLAELTAIYLVGLAPELRERLLELFIQAVRDLVEPCEAEAG